MLSFIFSLYGIVVDLPYVGLEHRNLYIYGRVFVALVCVFFFVQVNFLKKQYETQVPIIYAILLLYCVHGQYFVNGYYLAFMQIIAGFSLFFAMPKKYYYPITVSGNVLIMISIWKSSFSYSDSAEKILKFNMDTSFGVSLISIIALIGYVNITLARERKHVLSEKFLDVGRYFGNFVHELKGVVSSPTVYAEMLSAELEKDAPDMGLIKEIVTNLKTDVYGINQKILNINNLSKNSSEVGPIDIASLALTINDHFFSKSKIKLDVLGNDPMVIGNEYSVRSILLNLIGNSKENFAIRKVSPRCIQLIVENNKIIYRDNGGGFSDAALEGINHSSFFTEKPQGSGMGIYTIREYMKEYGGKVVFKNRDDGIRGVYIELIFAKGDRK